MRKSFYDVAKKKKTTLTVAAKKSYGKGKKKRYALIGETKDGRDLTRFCSKADYDAADVPVEK